MCEQLPYLSMSESGILISALALLFRPCCCCITLHRLCHLIKFRSKLYLLLMVEIMGKAVTHHCLHIHSIYCPPPNAFANISSAVKSYLNQKTGFNRVVF